MSNLTNAVDEIKSRANIIDVIGPLVSLKRTGANYKGCCPFHKEKTPSFIVNEDKGMYHCFGCGEHGDMISFVQKFYSLSFPEAVERLANQYGVVIEKNVSFDDKKKDSYYEANRLAARYFFDRLSKEANKGYSYMHRRGMDAQTMKTFGIGWATEDWSDLCEYMLKNGVSKEILIDLSLASAKNDKLYDKFRSRVIFPIFNTRNKIIGFGGRIVGEGEPKYLNSSENLIFQKKNNLYGLNKTKTAIQEEGYAIVVEGYMDCVSLYQYGVKNVVASLGTALTEQQAKLLSRYTHKVVLCYDADAAGINAAVRGIGVLRSAGLEVKVLHVDDGKDPDEYVKKHGRDKFVELLEKKAVGDVDYRIELLRRSYDLTDTSQSVKFLKAVAEVLKTLSPVEADLYIQKVSLNYHISEGALRKEVGTADNVTAPPKHSKEDAIIKIDSSDINLERMIIRLIMLKPEYYEKLILYQEAFVSNEGYALMNVFKNKYLSGVEFDMDVLKDALDEKEYAYLNEIMHSVVTGNDKNAFDDCIDKLETKRRKRRLDEIKEILEMSDALAEEDVDQNMIKELMEEYKSLQK